MATTPRTYKQATTGVDNQQWEEAIRQEMNSHDQFGTWVIVDKPAGANVVFNKWVFKRKFDAHGVFDKFKARSVACGNRQIAGVEYDQTFAAVAKLTSFRVFMALAASRRQTSSSNTVVARFRLGTSPGWYWGDVKSGSIHYSHPSLDNITLMARRGPA